MFEEHGLQNLHDFEARARVVMRKGIFDFVDGGFNDETTYKRTRYVFDSIGLVPRYLADVSNVDTSTTILGHKISLPVLAAPSAPQIAAHPDGDLATCRAAGAAGTIEILSHNADFTIEEVAGFAQPGRPRSGVEPPPVRSGATSSCSRIASTCANMSSGLRRPGVRHFAGRWTCPSTCRGSSCCEIPTPTWHHYSGGQT